MLIVDVGRRVIREQEQQHNGQEHHFVLPHRFSTYLIHFQHRGFFNFGTISNLFFFVTLSTISLSFDYFLAHMGSTRVVHTGRRLIQLGGGEARISHIQNVGVAGK